MVSRMNIILMYSCISQVAFIMAWITDGGRTHVAEAARVAEFGRGTGIFSVLRNVVALKIKSLRPSVERCRFASIYTTFWDKKLLSDEGMFVLTELVRIYFFVVEFCPFPIRKKSIRRVSLSFTEVTAAWDSGSN